MAVPILERTLESPDATRRLAAHIGGILKPGDTLLLEGEIGAGKTHFARSLIQSIQTHPEDVPSPTFTLIQSYDTTRGEVLHADLYRLSGPEDITELGLLDAFGAQICIVEWPDRLGADTPTTALTLNFRQGADQDARLLSVVGDRAVWGTRLKDVAHV